MTRIVVTGMGVVTSTATNVCDFQAALGAGTSGIGTLTRLRTDRLPVRIGAELTRFSSGACLERLGARGRHFSERAARVLRGATLPVEAGVCVAVEAFVAAGLADDPEPRENVALLVGGNNLNQRLAFAAVERFLRQPQFTSPRYALASFDTDLVGSISAVLDLRGPGSTVGGASAAGTVAVAQATSAIRAGDADACVVVGALTDFSELDVQALCVMGAMTTRYNDQPAAACRPFDEGHDGLVYGQGSAAIVLESWDHAVARGAPRLAEIAGTAVVLDGHHLSQPSVEGEARAMRRALTRAGIAPGDVQYVNAHGTSTPVGDAAECAAIHAAFGDAVDGLVINSTKSLIGHTMCAAGAIELVATIVQMNAGFVHPNLNLERPIDPRLRFAGAAARPARIEHALSNSFAFGGINSTIVVRRIDEEGRAS